MEIKQAAEREMKRMEEIFRDLKLLDKDNANEFYDFAKNYFNDGRYFMKKDKVVEAFEAFVISWAYLDIGLKLGLFSTNLKDYFTA